MEMRYLKPGEVWFGPGEYLLRTLLGSCVAFTLWHPQRRLAGMCHFVLPERPPGDGPDPRPDPRYGGDAVALLVAALRRHGTVPGEYVVGIYGGGNMFPEFNPITGLPVGEQNVAKARALAQAHRFGVCHEAVGGYAYRQILLDPESGQVTVHSTEVRKA